MDKAKLFQNGRSQAVRLPRDYRLPGREVRVSRQGRRVILEPLPQSYDPLFDALDRFSEDCFAGGREQPAPQSRKVPG
jgi:antitoxin VapB